ncbi:hypothetical protein ACF0H5_009356 [Mactra antiquata]
MEKLVDDKELEQIKTDIGKTFVKKIKEYLVTYIDADTLETELNKLKTEWALDDQTIRDHIYKNIQKDVERSLETLKTDLEKFIDGQELDIIIQKVKDDVRNMISQSNIIGQIEADLPHIKDNQVSVLLFSLTKKTISSSVKICIISIHFHTASEIKRQIIDIDEI